MSSSFAELIKTLRRESLELQSAHRRSTLTMQTTSKSITVPISATANQYGSARPNKMPIIGASFNSSNPQIYMVAFDNSDPASPFPFFDSVALAGQGNEVMIKLNLGYIYGQTPGATISTSVKINFISSGDFTLRVVQNGSD